MRGLVAGGSVVAGVLLFAVPRWVFPACAHGDVATRCADTARAEMMLGVLLFVAGALALDARRPAVLALHAVASGVLLALAWIAPGVLGYCASPRMPCHHGMVPSVRLVALLVGTMTLAAAVALAAGARRRREPT